MFMFIISPASAVVQRATKHVLRKNASEYAISKQDVPIMSSKPQLKVIRDSNVVDFGIDSDLDFCLIALSN